MMRVVSYVLFLLFLFEWTPSQRKKRKYPIRDFASRTEQTFLLSYAGSILTPQLLGIEPGAWLDTMQPRGPKQIGFQSAPGDTQVCALPMAEPQVYCRPSASHFKPLDGSLSTSHPQIPLSQ